MDTQEFIKLLKRAQGQETQKEFAERMGISPQYLNDVLLGKREPGEGVLRPMGVIKKVSYEKDEPYSTGNSAEENQTNTPTESENLTARGAAVGQKALDKISQRGTVKPTYAEIGKDKTKLRTPDVNEPSGKPDLTLEKDEYAQE